MMKLTLPEAAEAVADIFEGNPDAYAFGAYFVNSAAYFVNSAGVTGMPPSHSEPIKNLARGVDSFCAVGGVALAAGVSIDRARAFLRETSGVVDPEYINDKGRRQAINMLRRAAAKGAA